MRFEDIKVGMKLKFVSVDVNKSEIYTVSEVSDKRFWIKWNGIFPLNECPSNGYPESHSRAECYQPYIEPPKPIPPQEYEIIWSKRGINSDTLGPVTAQLVKKGFRPAGINYSLILRIDPVVYVEPPVPFKF